ncbi:hypothetical protein C8R41DRAFT_923999 [Lentinula lateritia]|uniref:Uncharacterized protein n=1 Tax=Lentinula lateritia TaxID=40482 RepID=A0ABQ8V4F0_9AGAR|nr:hypothetical protein C8R41DRAFT_923999 [Lentinula lateritia]
MPAYPISITLPTPKELAMNTQAARESTWGMKYPPKLPAPLPGWIRVKFYSHLYKIRHEMLPDMEGDVKLNPSGVLDMRRVCHMWNLERCAPIDPMRWIPVETSHSRWLSPLAVRVLSERNNCLMFIEPTPLSPSTAHKRELREASIYLQTSLSIFSRLSFSVTTECLERGTAKVHRMWIWLDERTKFPMWIEFGIMVLTIPLFWIAKKISGSFVGKYAGRHLESARTSCEKRIQKIQRATKTPYAAWVEKQMHWIVLCICLGMLMLGLFLLLNALFGWDVRYQTMALVQQPYKWARRAANGVVGASRASSSF